MYKILTLSITLFTINTFALDCDNNISIFAPAPSFEQLNTAISQHSCAFSPACTEIGQDQLRAQMGIDGDLMLEDIQKGSLGPVFASSIAVVDTGFETSAEPMLQTSPNYSSYPMTDYMGHGTAVSSLITGKDGVGLAPNHSLTIYQMDKDGEYESDEALVRHGEDLVIEACLAGNRIINYSQSERSKNRNTQMFQPTTKTILAERGCLVVMAAGNENGRDDIKNNSPTDAVLTVEASLNSDQLTSFSDHGEIAAPGRGVYTHLGSTTPPMRSLACPGHPGRLIDGTSFSTPLIASVAAQVRSILNQDRFFETLPGQIQLTLLNNILQASKQGRTINALRATHIAKNWVSARYAVLERDKEVSRRGRYKDMLPNLSVSELRNLLQSQANEICSNIINCQNLTSNCESEKNCLNNLRRQNAICLNTNLLSNSRYLFQRLSDIGHYDLAANYFFQTLESSPNQTTTLEEILRSTTSNSWSKQQAALQLYKSGNFNQLVVTTLLNGLLSEHRELSEDILATISKNQLFFEGANLTKLFEIVGMNVYISNNLQPILESRFREILGAKTINQERQNTLINFAKSSNPDIANGSLRIIRAVKLKNDEVRNLLQSTMRSKDEDVKFSTRQIILNSEYFGSSEINFLLSTINEARSDYERTIIYLAAMRSPLTSAQRSQLGRHLRTDLQSMSDFGKNQLQQTLQRNRPLLDYLHNNWGISI